MNRELTVLLNSEPAGVLVEGNGGDLEFRYEQAWRDRPDSYPLSLSLPLTRSTHNDNAVRPYLEGLLPDNSEVLSAWARLFQVSAANPFALLRHMGEDCAGAVQFVPTERMDDFLKRRQPEVEWLSEREVANRLKDLVHRPGTGRVVGDTGYFSLAGAQPKTAMTYQDGRWGIPAGRTPTTHIIKPPAQKELADFEINEHLCLVLARELALPSARSEVRWFAGQAAIVVARYDRLTLPSGEVIRIHQEDACQALAVPPAKKYEAEGGPGALDLITLLLQETDDPDRDVALFLDALALNWVIAGTDAHAKNYSLLIGPGSVSFAPLYDLVSVLPYSTWIPYRKARLAMRIDREYHIWKIRRRHWEQLAAKCNLDVEPVVARITQLIAEIPRAMERAADFVRGEGVKGQSVDRIQAEVSAAASRCLGFLQSRSVSR